MYFWKIENFHVVIGYSATHPTCVSVYSTYSTLMIWRIPYTGSWIFHHSKGIIIWWCLLGVWLSGWLGSIIRINEFNRILPEWCKCTAISRMSLSHFLWQRSHKNDEAIKATGNIGLKRTKGYLNILHSRTKFNIIKGSSYEIQSKGL